VSRTTALTASLVNGAASGSTANAWASPNRRPRRTTSISSARTASKRKRTRRSPRFPSSFEWARRRRLRPVQSLPSRLTSSSLSPSRFPPRILLPDLPVKARRRTVPRFNNHRHRLHSPSSTTAFIILGRPNPLLAGFSMPLRSLPTMDHHRLNDNNRNQTLLPFGSTRPPAFRVIRTSSLAIHMS
jgi:hypothetical protein